MENKYLGRDGKGSNSVETICPSEALHTTLSAEARRKAIHASYALHYNLKLQTGFFGPIFTAREVELELNRTICPLLRLPGEIRNKIYDFYFETAEWTIHDDNNIHRKRSVYPPRLLLVSRQIRRETYMISFSQGLLATNKSKLFHKWLSSRTIREVHAVKRVEIGSEICLGTPESRFWRAPMNIMEELKTLQRFPYLQTLHLHFRVSGQGWEPHRSEETDALVYIIQRIMALQKEAPYVAFSATCSLMYMNGFEGKRLLVTFDPQEARRMSSPEQWVMFATQILHAMEWYAYFDRIKAAQTKSPWLAPLVTWLPIPYNGYEV